MIRRLLLLNSLAAIGAVANHATGWGFTAPFWWTHLSLDVTAPDFSQLASFSYYFVRAIVQFIMFSVPAFFFVSGFFIAFATRPKATEEWSVILARSKSLIIPYILWTLAIILLHTAQGANYTLDGVVTTTLFGRAFPPYYYVPLLLQFHLLSPLVIIPLARKNWRALLFIAFMLQLIPFLPNYPGFLGLNNDLARTITWQTPGWFFLGHALWFSIGVIVGFNLTPFKSALQKWKWALLGGTLFFYALAFAEVEWLFRQSSQDWLPPAFTIFDALFAACFIFTFMAVGSNRPPMVPFFALAFGHSVAVPTDIDFGGAIDPPDLNGASQSHAGATLLSVRVWLGKTGLVPAYSGAATRVARTMM